MYHLSYFLFDRSICPSDFQYRGFLLRNKSTWVTVSAPQLQFKSGSNYSLIVFELRTFQSKEHGGCVDCL